jgi:Subtilase family
MVQSWPRRFVTVLALTLGVFALADRSTPAAAQDVARTAQAAPDEVSAARRFGRRAFGGLGKRRMAHRGFRKRWAHDRDGKGHDRPGDNRPGDNRPGDHRPPDTQGDNRPDNPGRPPDGEPKPGPRDHADKPDDTPTRDGPNRPFANKQPVAATPGFGPPPPRPPGGAPPSGTSPVPGARPGLAGQDTFVPDEILVTMSPAVPEQLDVAIAQTHGLRLIERMTLGLIDRRVVRYRIPDRRPVAALVAALRADARVADPQPNYYYRTVEGAPAPRGNSLQYALAKVDALRAHTIARGRGALVAVIDTGADTTHPDLAGAIVESFDAVGSARHSDPHGTAVAGIIAANGVLRGIAPDARLLNVRAFAPASDGSFAATTFNVLRGTEWALAWHARVLNMSFAGPRDALLEQGITAASERGAIIVAAAGNNGASAAPAYPAAYAQVIAVTAIDRADRRYAHANLGRYIALAAPGVDVLTASADHGHRVQSGTSFAAAHVSGIIAMMLECTPGLTADAARGALLATADDLGPRGRDDEYGAGRANAFAAVRMIAR